MRGEDTPSLMQIRGPVMLVVAALACSSAQVRLWLPPLPSPSLLRFSPRPGCGWTHCMRCSSQGKQPKAPTSTRSGSHSTFHHCPASPHLPRCSDIVFSKQGHLIVSSFALNQLVKIRLSGSKGIHSIFSRSPLLDGPVGMAFDSEFRHLYVSRSLT